MEISEVLQLVSDDLEKVELQFEKNLRSDVPLIPTVGRYVLSSGGKRLRPVLLLVAARLCGYRGERSVPLAAIVEFIHTATLLHDDVVDNANLRRGQESANLKWGNEASVLVGDFLFSKSFSLMMEDGDLRVLRAMSDATTAMAEGEVLELLKTCDLEVTEEEYLTVVRDKTAVLLAAACQIGALLGEADAGGVAALHQYGMDLGIAFQLLDDALDYVGDREEFGKKVGADLEEGKITLPLIHVLGRCSPTERDRIEKIVEGPELADADRSFVHQLIQRYGGLDYTRQRARTFVERAKAQLAVFPAGTERSALEAVAEYVITRSH